MKPWKDLKSISLPPCLEARPKDARGYPIPANVLVAPDGTPDFRVIDPEKAEALARAGLCALSGAPLEGTATFVGGPKSAMSGMYLDGPVRADAAEYALQVCPFLAAPKFGYAKSVPGVSVPEMSLNRPELFVAVRAVEYGRIRLPSGARGFHVQTRGAASIWKEGKPYDPNDALVNFEHRVIAAMKAGVDLNTYTASLIYGVPPSEVTPEQRQMGKQRNYLHIYSTRTPTGRALSQAPQPWPFRVKPTIVKGGK